MHACLTLHEVRDCPNTFRDACQVSNIDVGKTKEAFQLTQLQLVVPDAMPVSVLTRHGRSLVATSKSLTHKATLCMDQSDTDHLEVCCALASSPQSRDLSRNITMYQLVATVACMASDIMRVLYTAARVAVMKRVVERECSAVTP